MAARAVGVERLVGIVRIQQSGSDIGAGGPLDVRLEAGGSLVVASIAADGSTTVPGRIESLAELEALQDVVANGLNDTILAALAYGNRLVQFEVGNERAALVRVYPVDLDPSVPDLQGIQLTALAPEVRSVTRTSTDIAIDIVVRLYGVDESEDENSPAPAQVALGLYPVRAAFGPGGASVASMAFRVSTRGMDLRSILLGEIPWHYEGRGDLIRSGDVDLGWFVDHISDGSGTSFLFSMSIDGVGGLGATQGGALNLIALAPGVAIDFQGHSVSGLRFHASKVGFGSYDSPTGPVLTYESRGFLVVYGPTLE